MVMQPTISQPISTKRWHACNAEPPVVVTSSKIRHLSPDTSVEPSIPGGFPVFRPPHPLGSFRMMNPLNPLPEGAFAIAIPVNGTAPNSNPPTASIDPISFILS